MRHEGRTPHGAVCEGQRHSLAAHPKAEAGLASVGVEGAGGGLLGRTGTRAGQQGRPRPQRSGSESPHPEAVTGQSQQPPCPHLDKWQWQWE